MSASIPIGHAIYGEVNRGHDLLAASCGAKDARRIASRMDLRGSPPPHATWSPYISGFTDAGNYVLARTAPDPTAPRQMVFSRAFLIPLQTAVKEADIAGLIALLESLGEDRSQPEDVHWISGAATAPNGGLSSALLQRGAGPVIWPGQEGFAGAVAALWRNLWPSARARLSFRLAFSPQDVASDPPTIVCTPFELASRWSGFRNARQAEVDDSLAGFGLLMGTPGLDADRTSVEELAARGAGVESTSRLMEVVAASRGGAVLEEMLDAMRLAAAIAPDPLIGVTVKQDLVGHASGAMATARALDVRMARNLDLGAFLDPAPFWGRMTEWAATQLWNESDGGMLASIVEGTVTEGARAPVAAWRNSVADGIRKALGRPDPKVLDGVWMALVHSPELICGGGIPARPNTLDGVLARGAPPKLDTKVADRILVAAADHGLPQLHATVCSLAFDPSVAIDRHMAELEEEARLPALAAAKAKPNDLVQAALRHEDDTLFKLAVAAAAKRPDLLKLSETTNARWRRLLVAVTGRNPDAWRSLSNPRVLMEGLFLECLDGGVPHELIAVLAGTPLADLLWFGRRGELWRRLPAPVKDAYLGATADAWAGKVMEGQDEDVLEEELAEAVCRPPRLQSILEASLRNPVAGCAIFRSLPQLREETFRNWCERLIARGQNVSKEGADAIGRLIAARDWSASASDIAEAVDEGRGDMKPALSYVKDMLSFLTKWRLGILGETPSDANRWRILEEIGLHLYPYGPGENGLWTRAGGEEADIPNVGSGREAWRIVVTAAERGKGQIDLDRLIDVMKSDNPNNWALCRMSVDSLFRRRK